MAYASDQARDGTKSATEQHAISVGQITANVDKLGYDVGRTKEDDGAYKMRLIDRASGGKVDAAFDANTGKLLHAKLAREDDNLKRRDEVRDRREDRERREHGEHREKGRVNRD